MKINKIPFLLTAIIIFFFSSCSVASKQSAAANTGSMDSIIKSRNYIFTAQSANPLRGTVVQLTSVYDMVVANDTVRTFLPYFGRAYSAPTYNGEGGIKLSTTDFEYGVSDKRNRRWNISIKPNNDANVQELHLSVSENGYATLRVVSNNRDPITFNGMVAAGKK